MKTQVYEIKVNRTWTKVKASSIKALSDYVKATPEIKDWRMVGMQSRAELIENANLETVA